MHHGFVGSISDSVRDAEEGLVKLDMGSAEWQREQVRHEANIEGREVNT